MSAILRDPSSGRKEQLNFNDIFVSLQIMSFMNNYTLTMINNIGSTEDRPPADPDLEMVIKVLATTVLTTTTTSLTGETGTNRCNNDDGGSENSGNKRRKIHNPNISDTQSECVNITTFRRGIKACKEQDGVNPPKIRGTETCFN
mmetsp:Transcript_20583/g.31259  ORF Transcript_20583/g.31259 Transcript_20583/m.31259 type:complete len:145 (-) Transcript_20583:146-580(-)